MAKKRRLILKFAGLFLLLVLGVTLFGLMMLAKMARELPNPEQFIGRQVTQSTKIYDRTGKILLYEIHGDEKRTVISFGEIPDFVKEATVAVEDHDFYQHQAFDLKSMLRALIVNVISGKVVQGGSTITQQLARNTFLTSEKTYTRKIKELILSYWIEKNYSKDKILELYLNQIPYGSNAYGIESASQTFFNKPVKNLSLAEAATLAALIQRPSYYSPWGTHVKELNERKSYVLKNMKDYGYIDQEEEKRANEYKLSFSDPSLGSIKAPHFVMMVKEYLTNKFGEDTVEKGGLKVITTLDIPLQDIAEQSIEDGAKRNSDAYNGRNASLVAQDPKTGQILALVGSKDYFGDPEPKGCVEGQTCQFEGNFNVASQGLRQPGSSFKPFVYVTAFKKGYLPETIVFDLPTEFYANNNICPTVNINYYNESSPCFHPENYAHNFQGPVNLRNALAQSINIPAVKVLYLAGLSDSIKTAEDFGITTLKGPDRYGLSLVLGGGEVKLVDMVNAYSVFSQEGIKHQQFFILEVKDAKDSVLEKYTDQTTQVIDSQYPRLINQILSDNEARAPLFQSSFNLTTFPDREVALKTGTTNDYRDAWTIGYTPSLVVGVWAGNNNQQPMQKQGGSILAALPIWSDFMNKALLNKPTEVFNRPDPSPIIIDKPILNGSYIINNQVHDILFYVNKNDPLGPPLLNPESDSQFWNWENPVKIWIDLNLNLINLVNNNINNN